ncbi:hypothetical protein K504DRAFT_480867 [Pleomassaria siparia CBS 279.74]|uniref:BTB domain-containing protein n=1 Tax=Pleomassaria siparia CBS 279.74 TaxID=1314801 RepID=A0A6G1KD53_9PLEO|nr:hypothetical protein K504DRAFT_480867 [Pleomassaria siparia CBS 279.74]
MTTFSTPSGDSPSTIIIDKRGDVILQVGGVDNGNAAVNLLVSSKVLMLASPVLDAMFDGRFMEGQALSNTSPPTIPFPEDNPEAMQLACKLMHMQTRDISDKLDLDALVNFAILCDKYSCSHGARAWGKVWVSQFLPGSDDTEFEKLLVVAYLLGLPYEFQQISIILVRHRPALENEDFAVYERDYIPSLVIT